MDEAEILSLDEHELTLDIDERPRVRFVTNMGAFVVELRPDLVPLTVLNFLRYVQDGFYEGTIFHRVMEGFIIQGGGYTPNMNLRSEGRYEPIMNEAHPKLRNTTGAIAMARQPGRPDSATSQFFINLSKNTSLDRRRGMGFCVFGEVIEGMDTVEAISRVEVGTHPKYTSGDRQPVVPVESVIVQSTELISKTNVHQLEQMINQACGELKRRKQAIHQHTEEVLNQMVAQMEEETDQKATRTDEGIYYVIVRPGGDQHPTPQHTIVAECETRIPEGTAVFSTYRIGSPCLLHLGEVIQGADIGLNLIGEGGEIHLVIPPELAYGSRGTRNIPPHSVISMKIEIVDLR